MGALRRQLRAFLCTIQALPILLRVAQQRSVSMLLTYPQNPNRSTTNSRGVSISVTEEGVPRAQHCLAAVLRSRGP